MTFTDTKWTSLARKWMYYLPPGRPSVLDLKRIKALIEKYGLKSQQKQALILGSTPEYRDLLYKLGFQVTVVDRNSDMVTAMKQLRVYNSKENIHVDDWFSFLPNHLSEYNLILGDLIQGNVPYETQGALYKLIAGALSPGGIFIERVLTFRADSPIYSSAELFTEFSFSPLNLLTLNNMMFQLFFVSDLVHNWKVVDINRIYGLLKENSQKYPGLEQFIPFLREYIFGDGIIWYYGEDWSKVSEYYYRHLKLVEEIPDLETVYSKFVYIIVTSTK